MLRKYASVAIVKAKLPRLFLGYPKPKLSSTPFMTHWNIQEPFEKEKGIVLCHLILQILSVLSFALSIAKLAHLPKLRLILSSNVVL